MSRFVKFSEVAANVAIVVVAFALVAVLANKYFFSSAHVHNEPVYLKAGEPVKLPDIPWVERKKTVVIAVAEGCKFCTESAPFFKRLVASAQGVEGVHVVAVTPQEVPAASLYLNDMGVKIDDVRQADLPGAGIGGTPAVLLVDQAGTASGVWFGKLTESAEQEVLDAVAR